MNIKKMMLLFGIWLTTFIGCAKTASYIRVDDVMSKKRIIAVTSFTFPKNMTDPNLDRLKYLNTQIYTDYVLSSFISNFNIQNTIVNLKTLQEVIGNANFASLPDLAILGADYVAASGTVATNFISDSTIELLRGNVDGFMHASAVMSFWSQQINIDFQIYNLDKEPIWIDRATGVSHYIIGDAGPTRKTAYEIVVADVLEYQKRHQAELYTIIDESITDGISRLRKRVPYAFYTNDILFTTKTFSLTNEGYSLKAGIY